VKLRDGVTIYTGVFRPAGNETSPTIVACGPYRKEIVGQWLDEGFRTSKKFEAPVSCPLKAPSHSHRVFLSANAVTRIQRTGSAMTTQF